MKTENITILSELWTYNDYDDYPDTQHQQSSNPFQITAIDYNYS